jgi:hypothetical protein
MVIACPARGLRVSHSPWGAGSARNGTQLARDTGPRLEVGRTARSANAVMSAALSKLAQIELRQNAGKGTT